MKMTGEPRIGLALGGGGARGIAHIHVIKAFDDLGLKPCQIVGSSIGSIMGAGFAAGMNGTEIEEFTIQSFANSSNVFSKLWRIPGGSFRALMGAAGAFGQIDVEKVLEAFLPPDLPETIEELSIPLKITGTDYYANDLRMMETGDLRKALAASAAIPVLFAPVFIDGTLLIDGGINNPLPFDLLEDDCDLRVAVDVVGLPRGEPGSVPGRMDMAFGASQLMMQSVTSLKLKNNPPDLFLRPDADQFRVLDFLKVKRILQATEATRDEAKRGIERLMTASEAGIAS